MKMSFTKNIIGCIGKCLSGLTQSELDAITDSVQKTLANTQGRKIFREFLSRGERSDDLACLDFYNKCYICIETERCLPLSTTEPDLKFLTEEVNEIFDIAADLDGVPEIDMAILERFNECLTNPCRDSMLNVLEETKARLVDHLRTAHKDFRVYMLEPCPKTK